MNFVRPGEYRIKNIRMTSDNDPNHTVEISSLILEMNIYENMFGDAISANLLVNDTNNMLSNFPIIGQEIVSILVSSFKEDGQEIFYQHDFKVYTFTARTVVDNSLTYILELVSPEKIINDQKKVSASFPNKTPTDVAKTILNNNDFGLGIESRRIDFSDTLPASNFIIPNWKPFKALNWLAKKSLSMTGGIDTTVFFYEQFSGDDSEATHVKSKFKFKSFAEMFKDKSDEIYSYYPVSDSGDRRNLEDEQILGDGQPAQNRISLYEVVQPYNVITNINRGMYSSKIVKHNIIDRTTTTSVYRYNSDDNITKGMPRMNDTNFLIENIEEKMRIKGSAYNQSENSHVIYKSISQHYQTNYLFDMYNLVRGPHLQVFDNIILNITIAGNLERSIGDVITLRIPSVQTAKYGKEDNLYSGEYVITAIRHQFTPATYEMILNVTKDNYFKSLSSIREGK